MKLTQVIKTGTWSKIRNNTNFHILSNFINTVVFAALSKTQTLFNFASNKHSEGFLSSTSCFVFKKTSSLQILCSYRSIVAHAKGEAFLMFPGGQSSTIF